MSQRSTVDFNLPPEPSDGSLLLQHRLGDSLAGERLFERYASRLVRLAQARMSAGLVQQFDPEDIVQSVFRRFFKAVDQGSYDVPRGEDLWSLLMVIALNRLRFAETHARAARRDVRRTVPLEELAGGGPRGDQTSAELAQLMVAETLERMPMEYQQVVQLRLENYEVAEIATRIARSKRTTERILQDVRNYLRQLLDEQSDEDERASARPE